VSHLLAFGRVDLVDPFQQRERVPLGLGLLLGVDRLSDDSRSRGKEPLRSPAGNSPGSEIGPVDNGGSGIGHGDKKRIGR
jgi:hypothetical protein